MTAATPGKPTPKDQLKAMRIFCIALISGVIMFVVIVTGVLQTLEQPVINPYDLPDKHLLLYVAAGFGVVGLVMAFKFYNKKLNAIQQSGEKLGEKMSAYQRVLIIFLALCEGPALLSVIVLFLTARYEVLGVVVVMLAAMISKLPSKNKITELLQPGFDEQQQLD